MDITQDIHNKKFQYEIGLCLIASVATIALVTVSGRLHLRVATASLLYVIVIVLVSRVGSFTSAIFSAIVASVCLVAIARPSHSLGAEDRFDFVAIACFLITSLVIAQLVSRLRKMAEDALSSVNRRLLDAEERERAWVARELHDDVDQRLALVSVRLDLLRNARLGLDPRVCQHLEDIGDAVSNVADDIRELSYHLHSSKLQFLGIVGAARSLCKHVSGQHDMEIEVRSDRVPQNLPANVSASLFRVLEEALENAVKHSKSRRVEVSLSGQSHEVELSVRDQGVGFNPKAATKGRGLGLISMQERTKLVRGQFSIASRINQGTTVHVRVPLSQVDPAVPTFAQVLAAPSHAKSRS